MSAYGSGQQEPYGYGDYAATRPSQELNYAGFAQPSFASQHPDAHPRPSHEPSNVAMPYIHNSSSRDAGYPPGSHPTFISTRSRQIPGIVSFSPTKASHGDRLYIYIRDESDLTAYPAPKFSVTFQNMRCDMALKQTDFNAPYYNYELETEIPPFESTGAVDSEVPLLLNMQDENGQGLGWVEVGDFTYTDVRGYSAYDPLRASRKRKHSPENEALARSNSKRIPPATFKDAGNQIGFYGSSQTATTPPTPYMLASVPGGFRPYYEGQYDKSPPQQSYHRRSTQSSYSGLPSLSYSPASSRTQPTQAAAYSPYPGVSQAGRSPRTALETSSSKGTSHSQGPPILVRASTLPSTVAVGSQAFNPYSLYPNKAMLKLDGDLDGMCGDWTEDEWSAKRRLVEFQRHQTDSTITAKFSPVAPEDRAPNSACISCIWWEERQECYVTSVDTIALLEQLIGNRFTVEEKNRIRRNLEGFKPLTVSKVRADSEEFFKVIMGFPNPKPRNIEKDVKVFPWKILSHALKKIISKYCASYASTAGPLLTPVTSGYASAGEAGTDYHHTASPTLATTAGASARTYHSSMSSSSISPGLSRTSAGLGRSSAGHIPVPQHGGETHSMGSMYGLPTDQTTQYTTGLSGLGRTGSGAYNAMLPNSSSATGLPSVTDQSLRMHGAGLMAVTEGLQQAADIGDYRRTSYGHQTSHAQG